jgi:hypothetical protein
MLNAYGTIGIFETVGAFFAFFYSFYINGFYFSDLLG